MWMVSKHLLQGVATDARNQITFRATAVTQTKLEVQRGSVAEKRERTMSNDTKEEPEFVTDS